MRISAVLNRDGGTLRTADMAAVCVMLQDAFAGAGHEFDCRVVSETALRSALDGALADDEIDCVLAGGGDGSISLAAGKAWKSGKALAVLPAGTMNLFARSLGIPLALPEAVTALANASTSHVDIATANGRPFVHQYSVGMQPRMVIEREKLDFGSRLGKIIASARALASPILRPPAFSVSIEADGRRASGRMSLVAVSNNPHGEAHLPYPDSVDSGLLGLYQAGVLTPRAGLRLTADLTLGNWSANPDLTAETARSVTLSFPDRRRGAKAVIDGELVELPDRVDIRIHHRQLKVLLP